MLLSLDSIFKEVILPDQAQRLLRTRGIHRFVPFRLFLIWNQYLDRDQHAGKAVITSRGSLERWRKFHNALAPANEWRNCADPTAGRRAATYGEGENMVGVTIKTLLRHQWFSWK